MSMFHLGSPHDLSVGRCHNNYKSVLRLKVPHFGFLLLIAFSAISMASAQAQSATQGGWLLTQYNLPPSTYSNCFVMQGYLYCTGGGPNFTQATPLLSNGSLGSWFGLNSYPNNVSDQVCADYAINSYILCIGGIPRTMVEAAPNSTGSSRGRSITVPSNVSRAENNTYESQIYPGGTVSPWFAEPSYPFTPLLESCTSSGSYVYCIGGYFSNSLSKSTGSAAQNTTNSPSNSTVKIVPPPATNGSSSNTVKTANLTNAVYYAQFSTNLSISGWNPTTPYPEAVAAASCTTTNGYIYCVGGNTSTGNTNNVYYAKIAGNGALGQWQQASSYPYKINSQSCVIVGQQIYCIGGEVGYQYAKEIYYANILSNGSITKWIQAASYPLYVAGESCTSYNSTIYCVGGSNTGVATNYTYYYDTTYTPPSTSIPSTTVQPNSSTTVPSNATTINSTSSAPTIMPTVSTASGQTPPSTTMLQSSGSGANYSGIIIGILIIIVAAGAYLYLNRNKKPPTGPALQR